MNGFILFVLGVTTAFVQSTLLRSVLPPSFVPDPILLLVVYASLSFPSGRGMALCFLLGLLADLFSGAPEGLNASFALLLFLLNRAIRERVFLKGAGGAVVLLLLSFALKPAYFVVVSLTFSMPFALARYAGHVWLGELLSTLLLMPFLYFAVSRCLGLRGTWFLPPPKTQSP